MATYSKGDWVIYVSNSYEVPPIGVFQGYTAVGRVIVDWKIGRRYDTISKDIVLTKITDDIFNRKSSEHLEPFIARVELSPQEFEFAFKNKLLGEQ